MSFFSQIRYSYLRLLLLIVLVATFYSIFKFRTNISFAKLDNESVSAAMNFCGISKLIQPAEIYYRFLDHNPPKRNPTLNVGKVELSTSTMYLTAKNEAGEDKAFVKQYGYGGVRLILQTQTDEIFAIGDHDSYRLNLSIQENRPVLTSPIRLPSLFVDNNNRLSSCGFIERVFFDLCVSSGGQYSNELRAVFISGYSKILGFYHSYILGLESGDIDITYSGFHYWLGDIPNTGSVLLAGPKGFAKFDGQVFIRCNKKRDK